VGAVKKKDKRQKSKGKVSNLIEAENLILKRISLL
jgi:hypothetical protein